MENINTEVTLQQYIDYIIENDELKSDMYDFVLAKGQGNAPKVKYMLDDVDMILYCRYHDFVFEIQSQYIDDKIKEYAKKGLDLPIEKQWTLAEHIEYVKTRPNFNSLSEKQQNNSIEFVKENHKDVIYDRKKLAGYDWEYHPVRILKECLTEELERLTGEKQTRTDAIKNPFSDNLLNELEKEKLITKEPLQWVGANNLCAYFVDCYFPKHLTKKWKIAEKLFNTSNLRQASDLYQNNKTGKPKNHQIIDGILEQNK